MFVMKQTLQYCLRSTGKAFWLPLHGVNRLYFYYALKYFS